MQEQEHSEGSCRFSLVLSFDNMDSLFEFAEKIRKDGESGITQVEYTDKYVLAKVQHAIDKKELKRRSKGILLKEEVSNDQEYVCG